MSHPNKSPADEPATEHPQIEVAFRDETVKLDEAIAPLLRELWAAFGLCTLNSCQNNPHGWIWLHFDSSVSASDFLQAVLRTCWFDRPLAIEAMARRILGAYPWDAPFSDRDDWEAFQEGRAWRYDTHPYVFTDESRPGRPLVIMPVSVRFPAFDYERVLSCMQEFNGTAPEAGGEQLELIGRAPSETEARSNNTPGNSDNGDPRRPLSGRQEPATAGVGTPSVPLTN